MPVLNSIAAHADEMKAWRRHLHRHPELGFACHATADFVAGKLAEFGITEIHRGIAQSGLVAIIEGQGAGPTIGLRADMDALPITEATGADHASTVPGVMHACGHDGHTTMLLGAARYLAQTRQFRGRVALIFQPAEENGGGGKVMVDEGIMDRFGITQVYGIHNAPTQPTGRFLTTPGPIMASVDDFTVTFTGKGGHAAYHDQAVDPIPPAIAFAQGMAMIAARDRPPSQPLVISVTQIHAGTASNIVPETATVGGTVRCYSEEIRQMVAARTRALAEGIGQSYGVEVALDYEWNYPATVNDADRAAFAAEVARDVVGAGAVDEEYPAEMGSEDFSYMLESRPGAFLFLGQGGDIQVHHPKYDFNDEIAPIGASFFARLVERAQPL
jgi:hippurate hydrolase